MGPNDLRMGRFAPAPGPKNKILASPNQANSGGNLKFANVKSTKRSVGRDGSNSNSKGRFDFVGPYA